MQAPGPTIPSGAITAATHLAVPTGTAAASVIAQEPLADPAIDARRFARLAALPDIAFRANFEELVVSGVYTVLHNKVVVLRVIRGSERCFAVVGEDPRAPAPPLPRSGLRCAHTVAVVPGEAAAESGLRGLVEGEARQRPIFHGVTPDGVTYSGFPALHPEPLLRALNDSVGTIPRTEGGITVFALGSAFELPAGLVVGLEGAVE